VAYYKADTKYCCCRATCLSGNIVEFITHTHTHTHQPFVYDTKYCWWHITKPIPSIVTVVQHICQVTLSTSLHTRQPLVYNKGSVPNFAHTPNYAHDGIVAAKCWTLTMTDVTFNLGCKRHLVCQSRDRKRGRRLCIHWKIFFVLKHFVGFCFMSVLNLKSM
jgi:hypothetical protein